MLAREAEIVARVHDLLQLKSGVDAVASVVALGVAAVPYLAKVLVGPSTSVPEPRCRTADALATIGGPEVRAALIAALADSASRALDPVLRFAEDAVTNRIADALSEDEGAAVTEALLEALRLRAFPGCIRGLARRGEPRAIPLLTEALLDDFVRDTAVKALRTYGRAAFGPLSQALARPRSPCGIEPSSAVPGRAAAARILAEIGGEPAELSLAWALSDHEREVRLAAASLLAGRPGGLLAAEPVLLDALGDPDWQVVDVAREAFTKAVAEAAGVLVPLALLSDEDPARRRQRMEALRLLGKLGGERAFETLCSALGDPGLDVRVAAVDGLSQCAGDRATAMLVEASRDREPDVRRRCIVALGGRGSAGLAAAARGLADPASQVRIAARKVLLDVGVPAVSVLQAAANALQRGPRGLRTAWLVRKIVRELGGPRWRRRSGRRVRRGGG